VTRGENAGVTTGHELRRYRRRLDADAQLAQAVLVIRYEDLCGDSRRVLGEFYRHCDLAIDDAALETAAERLHLPGDYKPTFDDDERALIRAITGPVAAHFGNPT
jgi:hypothetical protein